MSNLEKLVFLEITNMQLTKFRNNEFYETYNSLSEDEKLLFNELSREIPQVWNFINGKPVYGIIDNRHVNSVFDYNDSISKVNEKILSVCRDFDLTLRDEPNERFRELVIKRYGREFYSRNFEKK